MGSPPNECTAFFFSLHKLSLNCFCVYIFIWKACAIREIHHFVQRKYIDNRWARANEGRKCGWMKSKRKKKQANLLYINNMIFHFFVCPASQFNYVIWNPVCFASWFSLVCSLPYIRTSHIVMWQSERGRQRMNSNKHKQCELLYASYCCHTYHEVYRLRFEKQHQIPTKSHTFTLKALQIDIHLGKWIQMLQNIWSSIRKKTKSQNVPNNSSN